MHPFDWYQNQWPWTTLNSRYALLQNRCVLWSHQKKNWMKIYTPCLKKLCQCYFVNNSVKHWPNLILFGTQHREETWHRPKRPKFCPPNLNTLATLPCEMQKSFFWTFTITTMNSCWVPHAVSENHCETRKSLKIYYFFNINQEHVYRTKISDVNELKRRVNSEWAAVSHTDWTCCWRVAQRLRTCVHPRGGHFEHIL